jgi:O-antigen ligase
MTEAARPEPGASWFSVICSARHDPLARILNVDLLAVLIAILLPWSTTGVSIAAGLWMIALVPTLQMRPLLQSLTRPICLAPIALFALALVGTLWSDAPWGECLHPLGQTAKLLVLPLLFYHFERSTRGLWVFVGLLASCMVLMVPSWIVAFDPDLSLKAYLMGGSYTPASGVFVKNYIDQSQEFTLCAVALVYPVTALLQARKMWPAALLGAIALSFVVNMMFAVISRTALVTLPVLLALFALLHWKCRTVTLVLCVTGLLAAGAFGLSPSLRATVAKFSNDYRATMTQNSPTGLGLRLEFWRRSLQFFADAPVIGHGTGSIRRLFEQTAGESVVQAEIVANPHNQTLNVAVQWGVIGVVVLYAMWLLHLLLFRGEGLVTWIGLLVVAQNFLTSLFNSHLFDFQEGWIYVLGVGVAGGMTLHARQSDSGVPPLPRSSCWQAASRLVRAAGKAIAA